MTSLTMFSMRLILMLCEIIGMSPVTPIEEGKIEFDYSVSEVKTFDDAHDYFEWLHGVS